MADDDMEPEETPNLPAKRKAELVVGDEGYIRPRTVEEALRMANAVVAARLAPDSYNSDPSKVMLGIMAAMEAGLPPLYGLRQIAIINGRPCIWGDAAMALVQSTGLIEGYKEERVGTEPTVADLSKWPDDYGWKVTIARKGQKGAYEGLFTVGMAKRARLWLNAKKVPWMEHPDRMLKIRARTFPLRDGFADALAGLAIREEVEDMNLVDDKHVEIDLNATPTAEAPPLPPFAMTEE